MRTVMAKPTHTPIGGTSAMPKAHAQPGGILASPISTFMGVLSNALKPSDETSDDTSRAVAGFAAVARFAQWSGIPETSVCGSRCGRPGGSIQRGSAGSSGYGSGSRS